MKIFHHNDNDGYLSASLIYNFLKNNGEFLKKNDFISVDYNKSIPTSDKIEKDEIVYIVDYSFTKNTVNYLYEIADKASAVLWIDHHKSSLEVKNEVSNHDNIYSIVSTNKCGAMLVYELLTEDEELKKYNEINPYIEWIVNLVDDYDRWVHQYPESMWFNIGSQMVSTHPTSKIWVSNPSHIIEKGRIIKEYNDIKNTNLTKNNSYIIKINNHECIVLNTLEKSSKSFGDYYNKYKFAIVFGFDGINFTYSIYSELDDIDCSKIAQYFNPSGGGHKGAAGFVSDKLIFTDGSEFVI